MLTTMHGEDVFDTQVQPDWVEEATPQVLADIWLARYGDGWIGIHEIEADFKWIAKRLLQSGKMETHAPAPDLPRSFKLIELKG